MEKVLNPYRFLLFLPFSQTKIFQIIKNNYNIREINIHRFQMTLFNNLTDKSKPT